MPVRSGPCTQACQSNSIAPSYFATSQRYLKFMWSRCGHWQPTKLLATTCHSIGGSLHPTSSHGSNGNGTSWALCCPQSSGDLGRNPLVRIPSKPGDRLVDPLVQLPKSSGDLLPTWQLCSRGFSALLCSRRAVLRMGVGQHGFIVGQGSVCVRGCSHVVVFFCDLPFVVAFKIFSHK